MLELYDVVSLVNDDIEHGVKKEYIGAVVDVLSGGEAYTVEFVDDKGETVEDALFTEYKENELRLIKPFREVEA